MVAKLARKAKAQKFVPKEKRGRNALLTLTQVHTQILLLQNIAKIPITQRSPRAVKDGDGKYEGTSKSQNQKSCWQIA
jgi:hypothetical protein